MKKTYIIQKHILFSISFLYLFTYISLDIKAETPIIFPIPQQMLLTQDIFTLDGTVSIVVPENVSEKDISLARFLLGELSAKYSLALKIEKLSKIPKDNKVIVMGTIANPLIKKYIADNNLEINQKSPGAEGYVLHVSNKMVFIGGWDDSGAFFGMQSLRQLIQNGNGKEIQGLKVTDWPNMPFRGIRLYVPGPENFVFFNRFIKDFMALYKYNKLIMEVNCMRLDKHPEVNAGWIEFSKYMQYTRSNSTLGLHGENKNSSHHDCGDGYIIEKKDVRNIVEFANQNFIEVIPEIPSLTHGYYLLTRHPELAEYPGDKWPDTYCPSNPASYKLMFDVYDEYMEVIKPKMVHIGHDEWWGAPMGNCPLCTGKDHSELFAGDITKIHDYFAKKGVKIAMWGDYLLESVRDTLKQDRISSNGMKYQTPGAVRPEIVQKSIPKDILIFNWFWKSEKKEMELQKFGFKQIYGNFTPGITNWDERIKKVDIIGGAPSVWTSTNEFNIGKECMVDFLGCANLLWSTHTIKPLELGVIVRSMTSANRSNLKGKRILSEDGDPILPVSISSYLNLSSGTKAFDMKLKTLKAGKIQSKSIIFELPDIDKTSGNSLIAVGSQGTGENIQPQKVDGIAIKEDVSSLIFLHACAIPAGNQKTYFNIPDFFDSSDLLGWYEIVYEDGYKEIVPIQYGVNILEWNPGGEKSLDKYVGSTGSSQGTYCYEADAIECSNDMKGNPVTFYAFEWVNKRFGKVIKEVNLHGSINFQATQQDYGKVETAPMAGNAVLLAAISKVVRRMPFIPKK
ncbi:MAG: family 20 glycosylhydrolase [Mariniphaga sp.]|nr:family 20 glycosylhydrolase [Mariniphaga sp.]